MCTMTQELNITEASLRPSSIQFYSSETSEEASRGRDLHPLPAHDEEELEGSSSSMAPNLLQGASLSKTKTGESAKGTSHKSHNYSSSRPNSHRKSLASFAERLRSRSHSRTRTNSGYDTSVNESSNSTAGPNNASRRNSSDEDYLYRYSGGRRSSDFTGVYADVARAQALFMEKLREEQEMKNIRRNVDGLPIPPLMERRRSSVTQILGMDKPLLSR